MNQEHLKWYSHELNRHLDMLVYGHQGMPIVLFPTSLGRYYQNTDFKLIESVRWFVEQGFFKIYCIDGIDGESWYNKHIHPADRAKNHERYDKMLAHELVPGIVRQSGFRKIITAGCSFGAYHATNFALRHPYQVKFVINMSGAYDIKPRVNPYYDDHVYFNNPVDFLPNAWHDHFKELYFFLGAGEHDICLGDNYHFADLLGRRGIRNWLDVVPGATHDWPVWRQMFPNYLSKIVNNPY